MSGQYYNTSYNGYYYNGLITTQKLEDILLLIKGKNAEIGDYLLTLNTNNNVELNKLINIVDTVYTFEQLDVGDEFMFYALKTSGNDVKKILYVNKASNPAVIISTYNGGNFNEKNTLFTGIAGDDEPNEALGTLFLKTDENDIENALSLNYVNIGNFIPVITGLSQFQFIQEGTPNDDKYVTFIKLNESTEVEIIPINFNSPYQGYYKKSIVDENFQTIVDAISEQKGKRDVVNGDALLSGVNSLNYKIYIIIDIGNNELTEIELNNGYILYNDTSNLQILKANENGASYYDIFRQNDLSFDGIIGQYSPHIYEYQNEKYYLSYLTNILYTNIYINNSNNDVTWLETYKMLNKFIYNENNDDELLAFLYINENESNFNKLKVLGIYTNENTENKYQGYANNDISNDDNSDLYILNFIQNVKENFVNIYDTLLYYLNESTITKRVNINGYDLDIKTLIYNNNCYIYNDDNYNNSVRFMFTDNMSIIGSTIDKDNITLTGRIENNTLPSSPNVGDLYLNLSNSIIYQYYSEEWKILRTNIKYLFFTNSSSRYLITTDLNNDNISILADIPSNYNYTYNGYYDTDDYESPIYYNILNNIKTPQIGDYLLLVNTNGSGSINLLKYTITENNTSSPDNDNFTNISIPTKFLYYSINGDGTGDNENKILFVNGLTVVISTLTADDNEFDPNNINFSGISGTPPPTSTPDENTFFLNETSETDGNSLQIYYNTGLGSEWIKVFNCLSKFSFDADGDDDKTDRFIVYTELNSLQMFTIEINYMDDEYTGYQGFYVDTIADETYETISNVIISQKGGRDVIIGDTLLSKYSGFYNLYIIISYDNTQKVPTSNIIFNDLTNLQLLKISSDGTTLTNVNGYFNQEEVLLNGVYSVTSVPDNNSNKIEKYYLNNNTLYINNNINYINSQADWLVLYNSLNKFSYETTTTNYISYRKYDENYNVYTIITDENPVSIIYQGYYYNDILEKPDDDDIQSQLYLLNILSDVKSDILSTIISEANDVLLYKDSNNINYISSVYIINNKLKLNTITINNTNERTFLYRNTSYSVESILVLNDSIFNTSLNIYSDSLFGDLGENIPDNNNRTDKDLYLRTNMDKSANPLCLYQYTTYNDLNKWYPLQTNNRNITYSSSDLTYHVITYHGDVTFTLITDPSTYTTTYQGYYDNDNDIIINSDNAYSEISQTIMSLKGENVINLGDILLAKNQSSTYSLYTITVDNPKYIEQQLVDEILFYNNSKVVDSNNRPILIANINNVNNLKDKDGEDLFFDNQNTLLRGYVGKGNLGNYINLQIGDFYLDLNTLNLYRYSFDNNDNNNKKWIPSTLALYNYKYFDIEHNDELIINIGNQGIPIIYNTSSDKYIYDGNYQGYYNPISADSDSSDDLIKCLEQVKKSPASLGDFLLNKINNVVKIYRVILLYPNIVTVVELNN